MKLIIIILICFTISALLIVSNNHLNMYEVNNVKIFTASYIEWMNQVYNNAQVLTGNIIKLSWLPE